MSATRKTITLPSGATVKVRRMSALDLASGTGEVRTFAPTAPAAANTTAPSPEQIAYGVKVVRAVLTKCAGKLHFTDGAVRKIVDKPFDDTDDNTEITIEEVSQEDANVIVNAVFELSGIGGAAEAAKFPSEQAEAGGDRPASEALPKAAD